MARFIGRKEELAALEAAWEQPGFQMTVIYGRRRVGKSTLIREFVHGRRAVYFTAIHSGIRRNLELLGRAVLEVLDPGAAAFGVPDPDTLLSYIGRECRAERTALVIDELPYLAEADGSILSVLQNYIDGPWADTRIHLILCGSSVSFMENEVLSSKSPLFGRRTSQIRLEPFDYLQAAEFVPEYTPEEKAVCYGVTGGVAQYLSLFDGSRSLDENIRSLFFRKSGYLYEEPANLLRQEFRNIVLYSEIIEAIALGINRPNEIADRVHQMPAAVSHALTSLTVTGIVKKEQAITDEGNRKKVLYSLKDHMFRFWYRFLPNAMGAVELGKGEEYYDREVRPLLHEYMGSVFEDMCRYYTLKTGLEGGLNCYVTAVGRWWGTDPQRREQTDIDVVGLDRSAHQAVLGECKFRNEPFDRQMYEALLRRNGLISHEYVTVQYLLFSLSGFTDWVRANADPTAVKQITLQEMYESGG